MSQFEDIVQTASEFVPKSEISNLNPDAAVFIPVSKQEFTLYCGTFEEQQPKDELWSYQMYSNEPHKDTFDNEPYEAPNQLKNVWTDNTEEVCSNSKQSAQPFIDDEKEQTAPLQISTSKSDEFLEKERLTCEKESWEALFINTDETKSKVEKLESNEEKIQIAKTETVIPESQNEISLSALTDEVKRRNLNLLNANPKKPRKRRQNVC